MTAKLLTKEKALTDYLNISENEVRKDINGNIYFVGEDEYLVVNNQQAHRLCKEEVLNSLWAFNADFIANAF